MMTKILKIDPSNPGRDAFQTIAHEIIHGRVIIYPTDTIYGIGADACNPHAVGRIFEIKNRDRKKPLLVLVNSLDMMRLVVGEIPSGAHSLMEKFWPGPLTLIFQASPSLTPKLTGGTGTIGIRYPQHPFCLKVLEICNRPIVSTSANVSGKKEFHSIKETMKTFESSVDLIVDAGDSATTLSSSVIDVTGGVPRLVREGAIRRDLLQPYLPLEETS